MISPVYAHFCIQISFPIQYQIMKSIININIK